jgi:hypothetical protein
MFLKTQVTVRCVLFMLFMWLFWSDNHAELDNISNAYYFMQSKLQHYYLALKRIHILRVVLLYV